MSPSRSALLIAAGVIALTACEPLVESAPEAAVAPRTPSTAAVTPSVTTTPTVAPVREQASRASVGRRLSPAQVAAMSQARTSVTDGDIMRQLANTAERIAKNLAAGPAVPAPASVQPGSNRALGYRLMIEFGWPASEWPALDALWHRESGWNQYAENRSSGAYGIPQSLPATKMAAVGPDWKTNPETQIRWGLAYIGARYGSPRAAWAHSEKVGWY